MTCRTATYLQSPNYKKMENANHWQGCEVTGTLISSWYTYNSLQPLWNLKVSTESKHMCTLWPRNYTPSYIAKRNMHMCSPKCMRQTVNNSTIPNSPKVETTQMPTPSRTNTVLHWHSWEYDIENEWSAAVHNSMNLPNVILSRRKLK